MCLSVKIVHEGIVLVNTHCTLARRRHALIVLLHVGRLRLAHGYSHIVRLGFGQHFQLFACTVKLSHAYERLRQIVTNLKVFVYLKSLPVTFHGIVSLSHLGCPHSIVLEHVEPADLVGFLFLFGCLLASPEQCFQYIHPINLFLLFHRAKIHNYYENKAAFHRFFRLGSINATTPSNGV